jgi:hypothetical protein
MEQSSINFEYLFARSYYFFVDVKNGDISADAFINYDYVLYFQLFWSVLAIVLSLTLAYLVYRSMQIRKDDLAALASTATAAWDPAGAGKEDDAWIKIWGALSSTNPADWKVAILEADNLLDLMVTRMGYKGANLGERLKAIEPSDFNTLNEAWEAHKIRNKIAHESNYDLTFKEAQTAIAYYEKVFREFEFI